MSVVSLTRRYTAEDLERLSDQGYRYELTKGELREMTPPGGEHGGRPMSLVTYVNYHVLTNDLGMGYLAETGFLVERDPDTVLAPDFAFISHERLPVPEPRSYIPVIPDLVMEARSPNDSRREVADKVARWLAFGVRVVWDVDPHARTVTVHRLDREAQILGVDDTLDGGDVLPGFSLPLRRVL